MTPPKMSDKVKWIIFVIIAFFAGVFIGYFIKSDLFNISIVPQQLRLSGYELINPLLECEYSNVKANKELLDFSNDIEKYIDQYKTEKITETSVYFRDLNNGAWFGIGEDKDFSPASLLKVPLMMAYLKKAETDKGILSMKLKYLGESTDDKQNIKPNNAIEKNVEYTVEELIKYMIADSDNNAKNTLLNSINMFDLNQIYTDLGIAIPGTRGTEDYMTVKEYASFFRILYNASYLNKEMSQKALKILQETDYRDGLVAGVPKEIKIAHKFGERKMEEVDQLHDCGIVYYPQKPYLVCVMTRGKDFAAQSKVIAEISRIIYSNIQKQVK